MSYDDWKLATPPEYDNLGPEPEEEEPLPTTCCMNVGVDVYVSCDKPAVHWYRHNQDICSYCEEHDYQCGVPIQGPPRIP